MDAPPGHGAGGRSPFDAPPVATAEPSEDVAPGTIRVTVVDGSGAPAAGANVDVGTMGQGGERTRLAGRTDESGVYEWTGLATGSGQAYRVNVRYEGATYSTTPFQLPGDRGYDARVSQLPITHDDRTVLQLIGQTYVEIRESRFHVVQQTQLANMSQTAQTYVWPEGGLRVRLPEGYLAFQAQPVMTDQHVEEIADFGVRFRGSLPPGRVTLTWAFDLPITGSDVDVTIPVPFRTYVYRVITDAPPGMDLDIDGLPDPEPFEDQGRPLFGTEIQRRPGDAPFESFTLRFRDIPGPGPARWIAVLAALGLVGLGIALATQRKGSSEDAAARGRIRRKEELLAEAVRLEEEHARGDIGPQFRQKRHDAIVRELAVLLHQEKAAAVKARPARVPARTESG
jgi:hypothetical protein